MSQERLTPLQNIIHYLGETTNMAVPAAGMGSFKNKRAFQK